MTHHIKIFIFLSLSIFTLISCQSNNLSIAESLSQKNVEILTKADSERKDLVFGENRNILGKSVAIFYYYSDPSIPTDIINELEISLHKKIEETQFFDHVLPDAEKLDKFIKNRALKHKLDIYLESLVVVSVSNKDISNPLGRYLACDDFLVFQIDHWPCETCKSKTAMRMKLRLVNAGTGLIYWTSIGNISDIDIEDPNFQTSLTLMLSKSLTDNFINSFKRKWHKKRFYNLAMRDRQ